MYNSILVYLLKFLILFVFYFATARMGLSLNAVSGFATFVWPPTGIALAALLLFGYRFWPAIMLAAFLVNFLTGAPVFAALGISIGNTLEALLGAFLLNRWGFQRSLERLKDVLVLVVFGSFLSTLVSATIGVSTLLLSGIVTPVSYAETWIAWWVGDMLGVLLVATFILAWSSRSALIIRISKIVELGIAGLLLFFSSVAVFGNIVDIGYPLTYVVFPPLIWIALRFRQRAIVTATLFLATIAIFGTISGLGPFATGSLNLSLLLLQLFLAVVVITTLILVAIVSERRYAEAKLFQHEQALKALTDNSPDIIARFDTHLRHVYVNSAVERITGVPSKQIIGKTHKDIHMPELQEKYWTANLLKVFQTGQESRIEFEFNSPTQGKRYFQARLVPEFDEDGSIPHVLGVAHDITELKQYQKDLQRRSEELEASRVRDKAILANIGDGLIVTDNTGRIVLMNQVAQNLLLCDLKDVAGKHMTDIVFVDDEQDQKIPFESLPLSLALKSNRKVSGTYYYKRCDNTKFPAAVTVTPLVMSKGIVGSVEIFRDITHEKELDLAKDEFISLVSHELRTPMTAVKGLVSMMLKGDYGEVSEQFKQPLINVYTSSERQIHLINDLLNISRLQTGRIKYTLSDFSLEKVTKEVSGSLQALAQQKRITLSVEEGGETLIQGDDIWVKEILNNLIGNAVKFTTTGGVKVTYRLEGNQAMVVVTDTGRGIPQEDQSKLFGKFEQLTSPAMGKSIGSGLGLYISREVARKMGGDVYLENSTPEQGSTFVLVLPKSGTTHAQEIKTRLEKEMELALNRKKEE